VTGMVAVGNVLDGVFVDDAPGNVIGGRQGEGNVISGNGGNGLHLNGVGATGNVVQGNVIGLDRTGARSLPNGGFGLLLNGGAVGNTIVLPLAADANRIGPNGTGPIRDVNQDRPVAVAQRGPSTLRERLAARRRARLLAVRSWLVARRRERPTPASRHQ
jgi:hypothetical protein